MNQINTERWREIQTERQRARRESVQVQEMERARERGGERGWGEGGREALGVRFTGQVPCALPECLSTWQVGRFPFG